MTKYVKLSDDWTQLKSALHTQKPRQIQRLSDDVIHHHNWFMVEEQMPKQPKNLNIYELHRSDWYVSGAKVTFVYEYRQRPLEDIKQYLVGRINQTRDRLLDQPILFDGNPFDRDARSMTRITGASVIAITDPDYVEPWITADNQTVQMTALEIMKMGKAQARYESLIVHKARSLKDAVLASDDPLSLDISNGWPGNSFSSADFS